MPNFIYKPIPDIIHQHYHFRRVQISGYSSVQSSSTSRSLEEDKPIYILKFKKIEQGKLLYSKIFPSHFTKHMPIKVPNLRIDDQEVTRQILLLKEMNL